MTPKQKPRRVVTAIVVNSVGSERAHLANYLKDNGWFYGWRIAYGGEAAGQVVVVTDAPLVQVKHKFPEMIMHHAHACQVDHLYVGNDGITSLEQYYKDVDELKDLKSDLDDRLGESVIKFIT